MNLDARDFFSVPHMQPSRWRAQGDVTLEGGRVLLSARAGTPPLAHLLSHEFYTDFRLECRCRYTASLKEYCGYGIWFRVTGTHGLLHPWGFGYAFQYDVGTRSLKLCKYPNSVDIAPTRAWRLDNEWHDILIQAQASQLFCTIDDEAVFEIKDWTFGFGSVGFGVWNGATAEVQSVTVLPQ
jgi:hypothetical protein